MSNGSRAGGTLMKKQERQRYIRELLRANNIDKQEDFVILLKKEGITVTQATISRDIKEMQLIKVPATDGTYSYNLPVQKQLNTEKKLTKTLKDAFISTDVQNEMCLIKVTPGSGPAIVSLIEQMNYSFVFGTLGGDGSALIICHSNKDALKLSRIINEIVIE